MCLVVQVLVREELRSEIIELPSFSLTVPQ